MESNNTLTINKQNLPSIHIFFYRMNSQQQPEFMLYRRQKSLQSQKNIVQNENAQQNSLTTNPYTSELTPTSSSTSSSSPSSSFQVIKGLIECEDSNTTTLAAARLLLTKFSAALDVKHMSDDSVAPEENANTLVNWIDLWRSHTYYDWMDYFADLDTIHDEKKENYLYFAHCGQAAQNNIAKLKNIETIWLTQTQILKYYQQGQQKTEGFVNIFNNNLSEEQMQQLQSQSQSQQQQQSQITIKQDTVNIVNHFNVTQRLFDQLKFNELPPSRENTFIQFICKPDGSHKFKQGRSFIPVNALYKGQFKSNYEKWFTYNVAFGELPTDDILENTKAILIPGSGAGAWEDKDWIINLKKFLVSLHDKFPHIRMVGICFGMQVLCEAFGGKVVQLEERKKNPDFHNIGNDKIELHEDFQNLDFVQKCEDIKDKKLAYFGINKGHGDVVVQLPNQFINFGKSAISQNEVFVSKCMRMIGFQGHPEYSYEWSMRKLAEFNSYDEPQKTLQCKMFKSLFSMTNDHKLICSIIKNYIKEEGSNIDVSVRKNSLGEEEVTKFTVTTATMTSQTPQSVQN